MFPSRPHVLSCSIAALLAAGSVTSLLADTSWTGSNSPDFNDAANWTNGLPANQNGYVGIIGSDTSSPYTATITSDTPQMVDFQIARGGGPALVNHSAGIAKTGNDNWVDIGTAGGTGTYNLGTAGGTLGSLTGLGLGTGGIQAGGGDGNNGRMYVGGVGFSGAGGTGTFNVNTSGVVQIDNDLTVGTAGGTGVIRVDAGTITTGGWNFIGRNEQGKAAMELYR